MEFELRDGMYLPKVIQVKDRLANRAGYCTRYARLVSNYLLSGEFNDNGKIWTPADAWNLFYNNRVAWVRGIDGELDYSKLKTGQILGIKIPFSEFNERRDKRGNKAMYSHAATCVGNFVHNGEVGPWISHNLYGHILSDDLRHFLKVTGSCVMAVLSPKEEGILRD